MEGKPLTGKMRREDYLISLTRLMSAMLHPMSFNKPVRVSRP